VIVLPTLPNKLQGVGGAKRRMTLQALLFFISGGNGNAAMIAALSLEGENLRETILTCRFAQKVARVVNEPR